MSKLFKIAILYLMMLTTGVKAQPLATKKLANGLTTAIEKAYPASVRAWGFDTLRKERTSAQFSGVVVTSNGHILTAAHTTEPGKTYKIFFPDGRDCIAVALGKIEVKETAGIPDVSMMKIVTPGSWPYAEMGFSSTLAKGETCISISYPESLNQPLPTLRLGKVANVKNEYGFIQSTCKMEPGDSGGPLFDVLGRVIGIHSAIDANEEMNMEIPVDLYRKYWVALLEKKKYTSFPHVDTVVQARKLKAHFNPKDTLLQIVSVKKIKADVFNITSSVNDKKTRVNATLFNLRGKQIFVSKSSLVGDSAYLNFLGIEDALEIIARDSETDLVLLKAKKQFNGGVNLEKYQPTVPLTPMGKILFSVRENDLPLASVMGSDTIRIARQSSLPNFGAMVVYNASPAVFSLIKEKSPAELAGLKVGDELISINNKPVLNSTDFMKTLALYWPDEVIELSWMSDGITHTKKIKLEAQAQRVSNHPVEKFKGGKSIRREGFKGVYTHDAALLPTQMGTAVFDSEANFVGINIARFSRASTLIMPIYQISQFINNQLNQH